MSPLPTASLSPAGAGVARGAVNGGMDWTGGTQDSLSVRDVMVEGRSVPPTSPELNSEECLGT